MSEIKPQDVESYRAQRMKKDGEPASVQTVNNDHTALKHCLNVAVRRGLVASNPAAKVAMPNPRNERDRVLTDDEWPRLYQASKPHLRPILLLAYHFGTAVQRDNRIDLGPSRPEARVYSATGRGHQGQDTEGGSVDSSSEGHPAADR